MNMSTPLDPDAPEPHESEPAPADGQGPVLRALIVDDEPLARRTLEKLLSASTGVVLVGECRNGREALAALSSQAVDLVFLDVEMPGMDGFEVLAELDEDARPLVVFVTAYDKYALDAFEVHAVDYLLKPFDDERFATSLARARRAFGADLAEARARTEALVMSRQRPSAAANLLDRITIHHEGRVEIVPLPEIRWIEAADQYVKIHTEQSTHLMRASLSRLERELDPRQFLRVHRSAIVSLGRVRTVESSPSGTGRLQLSDGSWVPVSRSRMPTLRRELR